MGLRNKDKSGRSTDVDYSSLESVFLTGSATVDDGSGGIVREGD